MGGLLGGGAKGMLAPPLKLLGGGAWPSSSYAYGLDLGGGGGGGGAGPPLPTPMD